MITINFVFWMFVIFFGIIGIFRGWAKELLVTFSVVVALTLTGLLYQYVPFVSALDPHSTTLFWINVTILLVLVYFGYQSISFRRVSEKATRGEKVGDLILSFILGAFNAYLVFGSLWFYMAQAGYPYSDMITAPQPGTPQGDAAIQLMNYLPPNLVGVPTIYFVVIIAFIFVLVVYV
jgi:uncharacterized membrane protein required for colicin V production